eukprot:NODE_26_length_35450_cov_0.398320.p22 type:complete len:161 gc:universal NODE_26_length_35450_cov_0.398320:20345-20827(+)
MGQDSCDIKMQSNWKVLFEPQFGKFDIRKFTCKCGGTLTKPAKFNVLMHLQNACPRAQSISLSDLIQKLAVLTAYDPLGWRYRVMKDGNVRSRRLPNSSYGYAWTCHTCNSVLPLDKESVYDHVRKCLSSTCLVKMEECTLSDEAKHFSAKLMYISDYFH